MPKPKQPDPIRREAAAIVRGWRKAYSVEAIASVLDVSKATVWRWEHRNGLPFRRIAEEVVNGKERLSARLAHNASVDAKK